MDETPGRALITGGSAGIGAALAEEFASHGHDLALVARREERLREIGSRLGDEYGVDVTVVVRDLAEPGASEALYDTLDERDLRIDTLVNNVGIGTYGPFHASDPDRELDQLKLNVVTPVTLSRLYLEEFVGRGTGRVLNIGSTAGFQPGPYMAGYYASKAYVNSFSQAVAEELRETDVTVTVPCPGPVETEFQTRAGMGDSVIGSNFTHTPEAVARAGYAGVMDGDRVVIPGLPMKALYLLGRVTPLALQRRLARWVNSDR
jgi:short-subunit dehydrogenase